MFWIMTALALLGAIGLISSRNPIYSVLWLIVNFFAIGGLFLTLRAEFLAIVQIIVYAGAILVLFLFVIMLLNLDQAEKEKLPFDWRRGASFILGLGFLAMMVYAFTGVQNLGTTGATDFHWGQAEPIGAILYSDYIFPFEMVSVVLLAALIGALVIAKAPERKIKIQSAAEATTLKDNQPDAHSSESPEPSSEA